MNKAIGRYGAPEIFNTDQGWQFTSEKFTGKLLKEKISISRGEKGPTLDNVVFERFWRNVKYEEVYLIDYVSMKECRAGVV